jgi:hypothetical protein
MLGSLTQNASNWQVNPASVMTLGAMLVGMKAASQLQKGLKRSVVNDPSLTCTARVILEISARAVEILCIATS